MYLYIFKRTQFVAVHATGQAEANRKLERREGPDAREFFIWRVEDIDEEDVT